MHISKKEIAMNPFNETTRKGFLLLVILLAGLIGGCGHFHDVSKTAQATITGCTDPNIEGTAMLKEYETPEGIKMVGVKMEVNGLTDGAHAVHIHETASCEPCSAAKGHHDPGPFGKSTPDAPDFNHPYHMGDLVNINVKDGKGKMRTLTSRITLSDSRLSIIDEDGSAFIIHTKEDLYCDQDDELNKGCAGGSRDACGIIEPVPSSGG
jgi:Cu-Zn family superoxide dismutase